MKGGGAHNPGPLELRRPRLVARHYHAREVVLFQWRVGVSSQFYVLRLRGEWLLTTSMVVLAR